jgi:hypothetical protein
MNETLERLFKSCLSLLAVMGVFFILILIVGGVIFGSQLAGW